VKIKFDLPRQSEVHELATDAALGQIKIEPFFRRGQRFAPLLHVTVEGTGGAHHKCIVYVNGTTGRLSVQSMDEGAATPFDKPQVEVEAAAEERRKLAKKRRETGDKS
jgi:hypothetical protein